MPLSIGLVHHPILGERVSGDAYCVVELPGALLVGVIDGLGHGPEAAHASAIAVATLEASPRRSPSEAILACYEALKGTRGAVLAVVRVDLAARTLVHAGLGNIETRLVQADGVRRPVSMNGIAGHQMRRLHEEAFPWVPGDLLLMHSDGISERFELTPASRGLDPQFLANRLANSHGRRHDDQLVLVLGLPEA